MKEETESRKDNHRRGQIFLKELEQKMKGKQLENRFYLSICRVDWKQYWLLTTIGYRSSETGTRHDDRNSMHLFSDQRLNENSLVHKLPSVFYYRWRKSNHSLSLCSEIKLTNPQTTLFPFKKYYIWLLWIQSSTFLF